jgi:DNA-binding transcriptional ArsR family regulator
MRDGTAYRKQAQIFRALSHPVRLRILDILTRQEACVCHLTTILGKPQPYVSQQLAALREAKLVIDHREANLIYYRLADDQVAELLGSARTLAQGIDGHCLAFPPIPESPVDGCPCPRCQVAQ